MACYDSYQRPYVYRNLIHEDDIRLAVLLPGRCNDNIQLQIRHQRLPQGTAGLKPTRNLTLDQIRNTLPDNWEAHETTDDRVFFYYEEEQGKNWIATWTHPNADFDHSQYETYTKQDSSRRHTGTPLPDYEALSYTWGNVVNYEFASVEDEGISASHTALPLNMNLALALRNLRYADKPRTLWIDAICLNQADNNEKSRQLPRMSDIYRKASRVVVWLGAESSDSKLAMDTLSYLGEQVVTTRDAWLFCTPESEHPYWCESTCGLPYDEDTWEAINSFISRDWFTRVWIIQEIVLANHHQSVIQCGGTTMPWLLFQRAIVCLWNKHLPACISRARLAFVEQLYITNLDQAPISHILRRTASRGCKNPCDRVYALMGLFSPSFASQIQVSYERNVADIYRDVTITHIRHVNRLELLRDCQRGNRSDLLRDAPSWVPDFSTLGDKPYRHIEWQFSAGHSESYVRFLDEDRLMEVAGIHCDTVSFVAPSAIVLESAALLRDSDDENGGDYIHCTDPRRTGNLQREDDEDSMTQRGTKSRWLNSGSKKRYITGESLTHALAKTLTGNYLRERFPETRIPTLAEWIDRVRLETGSSSSSPEDALTGQRRPSTTSNSSSSSVVSSFHDDHVQTLSQNRVYFETQKGYIGLGPLETKPGDEACVLLGCDSPMILRRAEQEQTPPVSVPPPIPTVCHYSSPSSPSSSSSSSPSSSWETNATKTTNTTTTTTTTNTTTTNPKPFFSVIGESYIHGFQDSTALLGEEGQPLPPPWRVAVSIDSFLRLGTWTFHNDETGEVTSDDPRLAAGPSEWEAVAGAQNDLPPRTRTADDPATYARGSFRHRTSGEETARGCDPRLDLEALLRRRSSSGGVAVERFVLV